MTADDPLTIFRSRLPWHGFGTDDFETGLHLYDAGELVIRALVQYQARHSIGWLVYDVDSDTAALDYHDKRWPVPNIVAVSRESGHAHYFYCIEKPIHDYYGASARALRYVAAVDCAMTDLLGADRGYAKLISKNPLHERWIVLEPRSAPYDLEELADWLDLKKYTDRRRRLPATGLGRNCTLFETLRLWAYRERRKEQNYLSEAMFHETVRWRAYAINAMFTPPLPNSEVRATAKSVAKWTWRKMSAAGFRGWQQRTSARAVVQRRKAARERHWYILQTAAQCPELTQDEIASLCGVSRWTVNRVLVKARRSALTSSISDKAPPEGVGSSISDKAFPEILTSAISDKALSELDSTLSVRGRS